MTIQPSSQIISTWAKLGVRLRTEKHEKVISWEAVDRLISSARQKFATERVRFRELINESNRRLKPLEDPLLTDFGVHRWLSNKREEAWSDWLEWLLCQFDAVMVFELFGLEPPDVFKKNPSILFRTQREFVIPQGHEGRGGRLDIVIRFGSLALIVIEVKVTGADNADTAKHKGYCNWIDRQPEPIKHPVLLAIQGEQQLYDRFTLIHWSDICHRIRARLQILMTEKGFVTAALASGFVGAVEQKLLGFRYDVVRGILEDRLATFDSRMIEYLDESFTGTIPCQ
jgi:hypothetical protein